MELSYDPAVPFVEIYAKDLKANSHTDTWTPKLMEALLMTTRKCLSNQETHQQFKWISKMWTYREILCIL